MAGGLIGSEILKIAADIRGMVAEGKTICNLTVGDFSPAEFRIPKFLEENIREALKRGETNYPPSDGMLPLKKSILVFYERWLNLKYPLESVLVTGGSRPGIYGTYRAVVDPEDRVLYPVPSWNNNHYCHQVGAQGVPVICNSENAFLPTRKDLEPHIRGARLLALNSPLNPTGTAFSKEALEEICDLVLEENARRGHDERPLFVMYDQVYWMLTFGATVHYNPVTLRPEMEPYTVFVDGISKPFAATGVRVGWVVGPPDVVQKMSSIIGHVGAWAPRAEQVAVAKLLSATDQVKAYHKKMKAGLQSRLDALYKGLLLLRKQGLPVDAITPMGAIYLTARFALNGRKTPSGDMLDTNEDIRRYLLHHAGLAIVPFQAFGMNEESGWFRLSVGAVSLAEIREMLPLLEKSLHQLSH
ncbi:MAG: aminotransferase class I/II-fold pyridoxal phosphate-dependent enzyme [Bacteroidetes bacterium]|nr:aminotransferase class I/II-fold pyridoxal phosphate-dependent enzyme [Bacteroidota bacterium]MCW5895670.1 aminotransferase class I/II-fold pyridoxal phosphate-dependent enzyme [Bacteroidota bacterium]